MRFLIQHRIGTVVVAALIFAVVTPFFPTALSWLPWSVVIVCLLFAAASWKASERFDAWFALLIALDFSLVRLLFLNASAPTVTLRTASISAYVLLHVVLLIGPWSRFSPKVRGWYKHRRHLGVTSFLLAFLHANIVFTTVFARSVANAWSATFVVFGTTGLLILSVLAMTSWDWFQKHIAWKWWTVIHAAVLAIFLGEVWAVMATWQSFGLAAPTWALVAFGAFVLYWIVVAPWGIAPHIFKVLNGWKQLHVLIYVAYIALVLHVYFGAAILFGDGWAQPLVLVLFAIVALSHLAGWIVNWREKKERTVAEPAHEPWHDVCAFGELQSDVGRRVDIHGLPVAIFLHDGKVLAFFGHCAHQKGPLWQGKIVSGYLTCPWHGYQYSVKDGKSPKGFDDAVPFYQTKVENGRVFVQVSKGEQCGGYSCRACSCRG